MVFRERNDLSTEIDFAHDRSLFFVLNSDLFKKIISVQARNRFQQIALVKNSISRERQRFNKC